VFIKALGMRVFRISGLSQELAISILSIVIPSLSAILSVAYAMYRMGKKFGAIEERFNRIDERFESLKL
jgi:hypothetical protein